MCRALSTNTLAPADCRRFVRGKRPSKLRMLFGCNPWYRLTQHIPARRRKQSEGGDPTSTTRRQGGRDRGRSQPLAPKGKVRSANHNESRSATGIACAVVGCYPGSMIEGEGITNYKSSGGRYRQHRKMHHLAKTGRSFPRGWLRMTRC